MTLRSRSRRHRSHLPSHRKGKLLSYEFFPPPSSVPKFFPRLSRATSSHVQGLVPPFLFTCRPLFRPSGKLLREKREADARSRIPNYGFVFPRRYLLFHGGVHQMNEDGKPSKGEGNPRLPLLSFSFYTFCPSLLLLLPLLLLPFLSFFFLSFSPHSPFDCAFSIEGQ